MRMLSFNVKTGLALCAIAALLAGCDKPVTPAAPSPDVPAPQAPTAAAMPSAADVAAAVEPAAVVTSPAALPATPAPPAPKMGSSEPALASMTLAESGSSKMGAPVDLRYQFDGDVQAGRPVTLHLAAVPRVSGGNLAVSIKKVAGIQASSGLPDAQKAIAVVDARKATAATAYRQQVSVSKLANGPDELRVLVTMDLPEGVAFSWFSVPLKAAPAGLKQEPVKQQ